MSQDKAKVCGVCGKEKRADELVPAAAVHQSVADTIANERPDWKASGHICTHDLNHFIAAHTQELLEKEKGELSALETEVIESLEKRGLLTRNTRAEFEERLTMGQQLADRLARFGGSWAFLLAFALVLMLWMTINTIVLLTRPFDPYPFILLNLVLSCLAAVQAPVIMMSQNRQQEKDRLETEHDYRVNLKAELEIRQMNEKIDHILAYQVQRFGQIEQAQERLRRKLRENHGGKRAD